MTSIRTLKLWWLDLPIIKRLFLRCDIKFSNMILDSENINFNGYQITDI